ncbi:nucleotidyltransferase family protein [Actinomadura chibensis]|uniref:nucleotidyltransferase family protein n=1 Tax=Actinomadura chibensis TaxID=392828 RepID=UPI000A021EA1|nr:nucleotidyltransferase family protein [Actinomadura chibensis]
MTLARFAAVLSRPDRSQPDRGSAVPAGVDPDEFRLALLEDAYEVVAGLELVTPALVLDPPDQPDAEAVTWPGTPIVREPTLAGAFAALHALGAETAALVAPDAPDLPPLLIGKLFRALGSAPSAACAARPGGGLVALAARLPLPGWLAAALDGTETAVDLDTPDALARLRAAAPRPGLVPQGPPWHRLRTTADLRFLDPGLEGWENTRALLEGHPLGS